ncbi:MAG: hypothetical protein AB8F94_07060 [Saprospiraceae bacterium]
MRILSWNCNMAFRSKIEITKQWNPDLLIIQECESLEKFRKSNLDFDEDNFLWFGDNPNKGLAIISTNKNIQLKTSSIEVENNRWFIPIETSNNLKFVAVWSMNKRKNKVIDYIAPTYRTIEDNLDVFKNSDFIIGDFNNNKTFDKRHSKRYEKGTFVHILKLLNELNFASVYHTKKKEALGEESIPTLIWRKNFETVYHVDYCFLKKELFQKLDEFKIIDDKKLISSSDHYPILFSLKIT